jgi:hypothetical protein
MTSQTALNANSAGKTPVPVGAIAQTSPLRDAVPNSHRARAGRRASVTLIYHLKSRFLENSIDRAFRFEATAAISSHKGVDAADPVKLAKLIPVIDTGDYPRTYCTVPFWNVVGGKSITRNRKRRGVAGKDQHAFYTLSGGVVAIGCTELIPLSQVGPYVV